MELKKMNIEDFKNQMYDEYTKLFPEDEQRDREDIEKSYYDGVEILYGIIENEKNVGFIMLEKLNEDYPYYIDKHRFTVVCDSSYKNCPDGAFTLHQGRFYL